MTPQQVDFYHTARWGEGYFSPGENGNLWVHSNRSPDQGFDLRALLDRLSDRGVSLPVLVRFSGILKNRIQAIYESFQTAIADHEYEGGYACVYPIKVNQQRQVVEEVIRYGKPCGFGLEAGSKPELLAVLALADNDTPIVCNGFKDESYLRMALMAHKMGRNILPVVERFRELRTIVRLAEELNVVPEIGVRAKLITPGSGRWKTSTGPRSKFGLTTRELLEAISMLNDRGMLSGLKMLHFHLGSQIPSIRRVQDALVEAARTYAAMVALGAPLTTLNVGGGLGVDYDGSQRSEDSSTNYTLAEYAATVVHQIQSVCNDAGAPHPNIVTESGRALVAHHSMLAMEVVGVSRKRAGEVRLDINEQSPQPLRDLQYAYNNVSESNLQEAFHDALQAFEMATALFKTGHLTLPERSAVERLYLATCEKIDRLASAAEFIPEELLVLKHELADIVFCNISIFQSLPDSWAIKQLFPILPLQRLNEEPQRRAILADMTCDSDGKIDHFIDQRKRKRQTLPIHDIGDEPYYLGAFLTGAYQEILGDLHNLFGDTNIVHVAADENGNPTVDTVIPCETVADVLGYVQFDRRDLMNRMQSSVEQAVQEGKITNAEAGQTLSLYEGGLRGSTYLS